MMGQKDVSKLTAEEIKKIKSSLGDAFEVYGKGDPNIRKEISILTNQEVYKCLLW